MVAADIFEQIFGSAGIAVDFFGGQWWLLGLFFLVLFGTVMYSAQASGKAIALMITTGVVIIISEQIFTLISTISYFRTILFFMLMFAGWFYYRWTNT
jgi:hypothetical protein